MTLTEYQHFCEALRGVTAEFPFDEKTLVHKVKGKMFALTNFEHFNSISLKCDPDDALALREKYQAVRPGYHLNKRHWNTIDLDGSVEEEILFKWIKESYQLVVRKLPLKVRRELEE